MDTSWRAKAMSVVDRISKNNIPTSRNIIHRIFHHVNMNEFPAYAKIPTCGNSPQQSTYDCLVWGLSVI